jgi:hypothetical protein
MPAFTFEKITPPARSGALAPLADNTIAKHAVVRKQRGLIVQILDRFVEARVKRSLREERSQVARQSKSAD